MAAEFCSSVQCSIRELCVWLKLLLTKAQMVFVHDEDGQWLCLEEGQRQLLRSSCIQIVVIFAMFGEQRILLLFSPRILYLIPFLHLLLGSFVSYSSASSSTSRVGPSHQRLFANAVVAFRVVIPVGCVFICHRISRVLVLHCSSAFIIRLIPYELHLPVCRCRPRGIIPCHAHLSWQIFFLHFRIQGITIRTVMIELMCIHVPCHSLRLREEYVKSQNYYKGGRQLSLAHTMQNDTPKTHVDGGNFDANFLRRLFTFALAGWLTGVVVFVPVQCFVLELPRVSCEIVNLHMPWRGDYSIHNV